MYNPFKKLFKKREKPKKVGEMIDLEGVSCVEEILDYFGVETDDTKFPDIHYHPRTALRYSKFATALYNAEPRTKDEKAEVKIGRERIEELKDYKTEAEEPRVKGYLETYYTSILNAGRRLYKAAKDLETRLQDIKGRKTKTTTAVKMIGKGGATIFTTYALSKLSGSFVDEMEADIGGVKVRGYYINLLFTGAYLLVTGFLVNKAFKGEEQIAREDERIKAGTIHTQTVLEVVKEAGRFFPGFVKVDTTKTADVLDEWESGEEE